MHPTAVDCMLPSKQDCADRLASQMGWGPPLVTATMRRALAGECGVGGGLQAGPENAAALGCPGQVPLMSLYAAHDTHMNLWSAMLAPGDAGGALSPDNYWPWTTANFAWELWTEDGRGDGRGRVKEEHAWVRVLYGDAPVPLEVGGRKREWVTLREWEEAVAKYGLAADKRKGWCAA